MKSFRSLPNVEKKRDVIVRLLQDDEFLPKPITVGGPFGASTSTPAFGSSTSTPAFGSSTPAFGSRSVPGGGDFSGGLSFGGPAFGSKN